MKTGVFCGGGDYGWPDLLGVVWWMFLLILQDRHWCGW